MSGHRHIMDRVAMPHLETAGVCSPGGSGSSSRCCSSGAHAGLCPRRSSSSVHTGSCHLTQFWGPHACRRLTRLVTRQAQQLTALSHACDCSRTIHCCWEPASHLEMVSDPHAERVCYYNHCCCRLNNASSSSSAQVAHLHSSSCCACSACCSPTATGKPIPAAPLMPNQGRAGSPTSASSPLLTCASAATVLAAAAAVPRCGGTWKPSAAPRLHRPGSHSQTPSSFQGLAPPTG